MNTKEFIRIQLDAPPDAVRAWLESAAAAAEQIGERPFSVASLEIDRTAEKVAAQSRSVQNAAANGTDTAAEAPADEWQHRRRYGIFDGDGVLVVNADLRCADAQTTLLELRRDDAFPLVATTLMQRLEERFPGASGEMLAEKPRERSGAPPLACNVWLEEQLRKLPDPKKYHHLYAKWLAHYVSLRGYEPVDPRRSFRAAARGCLKRMRT